MEQEDERSERSSITLTTTVAATLYSD
jgi:hypothetical protein